MSDSPKLTTKLLRDYGSAALVLCVGLVFSLAACLLIRNELKTHHWMEFQWVAHNRNRALKKGIQDGLETVESIGDLFLAFHDVKRDEFRLFADEQLFRHRDIDALEWVPFVASEGRSEHESAGRLVDARYQILERAGEGKLVRARQRKGYFPAFFVEPAGENNHVLGLDLASDPIQRKAMDRARSTGRMSVSGRMKLPGSTDSRYVFMAFLPIYGTAEVRPGIPLLTGTDDRLRGFVAGVFRIGDIANASISLLEPRGVEFLVRDESAPKAEQFLDFYTSRLNPNVSYDPITKRWSGWSLADPPQIVEKFQVADRQWSITCAPTGHFRSAEGFDEGPWIVLACGVLLSVVLASYLLQNRRSLGLRMRIEGDLRESEQKLRILFNQSPDIIMTVDREGFIRMVNRNMPGGRRSHGVGQISEAFLPEHLREAYRISLSKVFQSGEIEHLQYSSTNETRWEIRIVPLRADGGVDAAMVIATDVTEKRALEAQAIRNARLASLGVLAASVAHEVNNPNNAIQFNASILSRSWDDVHAALDHHASEHEDYTIGGMPVEEAIDAMPKLFAGISRSSHRIKTIVANLKRMARHDGGDLDEDVDVLAVLTSSVSILKNQVQRHTDHFHVSLAEGTPVVKGNRQQLEQVFMNLILNALQSLPNRDAYVRLSSSVKNDGEKTAGQANVSSATAASPTTTSSTS